MAARVGIRFLGWALLLLVGAPSLAGPAKLNLLANTWVLLRKDDLGGRRGGAVRYATYEKKFLLWGFMDADPEFLQENPSMSLPEHDIVYFDVGAKQWRDHASKTWVDQQAKKKPLYFVPRCYHGLTSGSERSLFRAPQGYPAESARPDLNIAFDQVAYHPPSRSLVYFTGGLTTSYHVETRRWTNLTPTHWPPPVLGGSLGYDSLHDEMVLFGGGHVAERRSDGRVVGHSGTWIYSCADIGKIHGPALVYSPSSCRSSALRSLPRLLSPWGCRPAEQLF